MNRIIAGAGVVNQTPLDWNGNRDRLISIIEKARSRGVQALCLPELAICGYGCEDVFHAPWIWDQSWQTLKEILPHCRGIITGLGLPIPLQNRLYNSIAVVVDGQCVGLVAKQKLAGDGIHYEPRWFKPWPKYKQSILETDLGSLPIGDVCFDIGGLRLGFEICEDAWVADRPGIRLMERGVDLIFNPSASHFAFGKRRIRQKFVVEGSRAFGAAYVYANLLGNEAGRAIYDGSSMIASGGQLLAEGPRFSYRDSGLIYRELILNVNRGNRSRIFSNIAQKPTSEDSESFVHRIGVPTDFFKIAQSVPDADAHHCDHTGWESTGTLKHEEFARAVALGLLDYMRKTRSNGFVVSLSGGADSAAVACLVGMMIRLGVNEIGASNFAARIAFPFEKLEQEIQNSGDTMEKAMTRLLLTTVYQGTENSSQTTRNAARSVAEGLGAEFTSLDIQDIVMAYHSFVSKAVGRSLDWDQDDIALQNIQARVRSPGIWMITNIKGALLLSTSNRSEAAVGYATMDGDTSGGLSPIAGIDKAYLREWLQWIEKNGLDGLEPFAFLKSVNDQSPTAELRPPDKHQTDEADLMPYPLLNRIESLAIRDLQPPIECYQSLKQEYPDLEPAFLKESVRRFFRLWGRNQWKRERYAPSFHLDDRNLDPRTWCRFPILNSGFSAELDELNQV